MTRRPAQTSAGEQGQASLLILGFFLVAVLLVAVVVDASAAYLHRQRLDALADGAALAATQGLETERIYDEGVGERLWIDPLAAREHARAYLTDLGATRTDPGLTLILTAAEDRVEVRVAAPLDLPFAPPGWASRTVVSSTAASTVQVIDGP